MVLDMVGDDGCPTCGSAKFEIIESDVFGNGEIHFKCNNCKKFWYTLV